MDDINKYLDYKVQHTYLVRRKMENDLNNTVMKELLYSNDNNARIRDIYE